MKEGYYMSDTKFNSELAAHNVATILTQSCIGEIDKEQIPISASHPTSDFFEKYSKQYAYYYKGFYKEALRHFNGDLSDY